jgi:Cyclic nucleotide-binding domain.
MKDGKVVRQLHEGDTFGEAALLEHNNVRAMSVKAATEVVCLALGRENLTAILGDRVQNIAYRNLEKWAFEKHPLLKNLTQMQKEKVFEAMRSYHGERNQMLLAKGQKCQKLIVPMDGNLIYVGIV